jgi:hypothetical protein
MALVDSTEEWEFERLGAIIGAEAESLKNVSAHSPEQ